MKYLFVVLTIVILAGCGDSKKAELNTDLDSVSYSIGLDVGTTFQRQGIEISHDAFLQGLKDASDTSGTRLLTDEQIQATMMAFQQKMMAQAQEKVVQQSGTAIVEGEKFLAENKTKPGVVTTESGLQYKIIKEGKGKRPKASNEVKVHYKGSLINGTVFNNSYEQGEPITFPVGGVIPGWTEVLQLMPVGSTWEVCIPSHLGYGNNAAGPIPPGSTLIFTVELLGIEK